MEITWTPAKRDALHKAARNWIIRATGPDRVGRKTIDSLVFDGLLEFRGSPDWGWVLTPAGESHWKHLVSPSRPGPKTRSDSPRGVSRRLKAVLRYAAAVGPATHETHSGAILASLQAHGWLDSSGQITELGLSIIGGENET